MLGDGKAAAAEVQKFIEHYAWWGTFRGEHWLA